MPVKPKGSMPVKPKNKGKGKKSKSDSEEGKPETGEQDKPGSEGDSVHLTGVNVKKLKMRKRKRN